MTTEADIAELQALGADLAEALQSPLEPQCIAQAFATPTPGAVIFTMQAWIDLAAINSRYLVNGIPETPRLLDASARVFGRSVDGMTPDDAAAVALEIKTAIDDGFAMALPMRPPEANANAGSPDGFGGWLPLWGFLTAQAGIQPSEARTMPVGQAYATMASIRRNQGWVVAGEVYALRNSAVQQLNEEADDVR